MNINPPNHDILQSSPSSVNICPDIASGRYGHKRLQSMDMLKLLAIFLVLWGHSEQYLLSCDFSDRAVYRHIYSFHMPLFMMISGFFFAMTIKPGVSKNILAKARQLLLPAVCWTVIFELLSVMEDKNLFSLQSLSYGMLSSFWFLKSAFACSILGMAPFLIFRRHFILASFISLIVSQLLFKLPMVNLPFMYPAFLTGGIIYRYHDRFIACARWIIPLCGGVCIICNMFLDADAYRTMKMGSALLADGSVIEPICWRIYKYFMGLCGAVAFIVLFDVIFSSPRTGRVFTIAAEWGKMTLGIYILQTFLLERLLADILNFDGVPDLLFDFVISPLISFGVMAVCVGIIRQNRYASFFLLGSKLR